MSWAPAMSSRLDPRSNKIRSSSCSRDSGASTPVDARDKRTYGHRPCKSRHGPHKNCDNRYASGAKSRRGSLYRAFSGISVYRTPHAFIASKRGVERSTRRLADHGKLLKVGLPVMALQEDIQARFELRRCAGRSRPNCSSGAAFVAAPRDPRRSACMAYCGRRSFPSCWSSSP